MIRRHIIPYIGKIHLKQVDSEVVQRYINQKLRNGRLDGKGGLSPKTARDIVGLLKRSLKTVGVKLDITMPKYSLPKLRVLTQDEQSALITAARMENNTEGLGVLLSLFTGIRIGELCSLKWSDISLNDGILKINKTLQRIENCEINRKSKTVIDIGTPKSECSMRDIPLPHFLLCQLAQLKKSAHDEDYILSGSNHYVEPRLCQYRFKRMLKNAGIGDINFHALRHTFATRCIELGVDVKTISELLGHSNVNITLNRYVHPAFEHQRDCLEKLSVSF
jgi:integrase